jgi:Tol biopolymer transport system component
MRKVLLCFFPIYLIGCSANVDSPTVPDPPPPVIPDPYGNLSGLIVFASRSISDSSHNSIGVYEVEKKQLHEFNFTADNAPEAKYWYPRLSYDRSTVYFYSDLAGNPESMDIYSMAPDGTSLKNITNTLSISETFAAPSPDGTKLVFLRKDSNGDQQLFLMDPDGTNNQQLSHFSKSTAKIKLENPIWTKDGSSIILSGNIDTENFSIYAYDWRNNISNRIFAGYGTNLYSTSISNEGNKILYYSSIPGASVVELFSINMNGTDAEQLTRFNGVTAEATWSPDGKIIALASNFETDTQLFDLYFWKIGLHSPSIIPTIKTDKYTLDWK